MPLPKVTVNRTPPEKKRQKLFYRDYISAKYSCAEKPQEKNDKKYFSVIVLYFCETQFRPKNIFLSRFSHFSYGDLPALLSRHFVEVRDAFENISDCLARIDEKAAKADKIQELFEVSQSPPHPLPPGRIWQKKYNFPSFFIREMKIVRCLIEN